MIRFEVHQPDTLDEVFSLLLQYGDDASLLAGGTALLIDMKHGECHPGHLVSLWDIPGLTGVHTDNGVHAQGLATPALRAGALTTITDIAGSVRDCPPMQALREAAWMLGSLQIQNVATLGGNICKASPGADMVPPLLCLDAILKLAGPQGERLEPLDGFLIGPDQTAIHSAEVLTEILVPGIPPRTGTAFLKIMRRRAVDCSIVAAAARVSLAEDRKACSEARIAIGAAAPNPFRARQAEALLVGQVIDRPLAREAGRLARAEARPISDVRASASYRSLLVETLVERAVLIASQRASE